jgi:hypothetical protein
VTDDPVSLAHHNAVAERDVARLAEVGELGRRLRDAEARAAVVRSQLDQRLHFFHEDGVPVAALARAAGVSEAAAFEAIDRHRAL